MTTPDLTPLPVTKTTDPTLGLLSHSLAVGVGAIAAFLAHHFAITLSLDTQAELVAAAGTLATTLAHYVQAKMNAKKVNS